MAIVGTKDNVANVMIGELLENAGKQAEAAAHLGMRIAYSTGKSAEYRQLLLLCDDAAAAMKTAAMCLLAAEQNELEVSQGVLKNVAAKLASARGSAAILYENLKNKRP